MRELSNTIALYIAYLGVSMPSTSLNTKGYLTFQGKEQKRNILQILGKAVKHDNRRR